MATADDNDIKKFRVVHAIPGWVVRQTGKGSGSIGGIRLRDP